MKHRILSLITFAIVFLVSCNSSSIDTNSLEGKKAQLEKYFGEQAALETKIAALEKEIAALDTTKKADVVKTVAVTALTAGKFSSQVEVMGKIDVDANANISPNMGGNVTKIFVKEGSYVKKGQTLATIDNQVLLTNIAQLKQQLGFVTEIYNKQKNLWDQKIGSEVQYLQAKNNKENLEANLNTLYEQNELYKIKALYPGVVDQVFIKLGQTAAPGMPAFRVVGTTGLKLIAQVPESYISKVKKGNQVIIYLPDLDKEIKGTVTYLSQVVDPMNRTYNAEINIPGNRNEIKTNMIGVLKIKDYVNPKAISIPLKNLLKNTEGYYVFIAKEVDGKKVAAPVNITTGSVSADNIEVLSGLKEGDELITSGFQSINEGDVLQYSK